MINNEEWEIWDRKYFWPNATCQKLFYNNHVVVNSISDAKPDMELSNHLKLSFMF